MRLRKLLLAAGAIAASGALALTPMAGATNPTGGPIATVVVGGSAANVDHSTTLTLKTAQLRTAYYGVPTTVTCSPGTGAGVVKGGASGLSPLAGEVITSMYLTCGSFIPSTTVSITAVCDLEVVFADANVHTGLVDVGVPGTSKFSAVDGIIHMTGRTTFTPCLRVDTSNGCRFWIGGSTAVQLDEAVKVVGTQNQQDLHLLGGPGLTVKTPSNCSGAFANNNPLTLTAVFNEHLVDGTIDFQP